MKKITKKICEAFYEGKRKTIGNSTVSIGDTFKRVNSSAYTVFPILVTDPKKSIKNVITLSLHNHPIAQLLDGDLWITNAGYLTSTTKDRLNGLNNVSIYQKNFKWYLNDKEWHGKWTNVRLWNMSDEEKRKSIINYVTNLNSEKSVLDLLIETIEIIRLYD